MVERVFCGLDVGTTHVKAVVLDQDGAVRGVARTATPVLSDGAGDVHDPGAVCEVAESVIARAVASAGRAARLAAIGVASVGEEGVPMGENGEVLHPSIAWYDRRGCEAQRRWCDNHPENEFFAITGMHHDLGLTVFKWLWLASNRPQAWASCRRWLGLGEYLVWRWTGAAAAAQSHACRTGLFDANEFGCSSPGVTLSRRRE